jgi:hypothetical protein
MDKGNVTTVLLIWGPSTFLFMLLVLALTGSWEGTKGSQRPPKKHTRTGGLAVNVGNCGVY